MRYFDTNQKECLSCSSKHANCLRCNEDRCTQCRDGYYLNGRTCVHCHQLVENCAECNSNGGAGGRRWGEECVGVGGAVWGGGAGKKRK